MPTAPVASTLRISHVPGSDPAIFQVTRLSDGKTTPPTAVLSPVNFPVAGRQEGLLEELQWYLESFLDYPYSPDTEHAERILASLRAWGEQAFLVLFGERAAARLFDASTAAGYSNLDLQIAGDDPRVLAWPWEALRDPELGWLAQTCQIERRLNTVRDPQPIPDSLPKDRVNILLVVARPFGERDVSFRSIARPLVDLVEKQGLPASVELLRPPTFDRLREHLRERPGHYHILHFDGHGGYGEHSDAAGGFKMQGPEGMLVFEDEDGKPDPIPAEKLSALLRECALPGVVLNACQSAMIDAGAQDPFASIATALLRSGMRDVVAMAYSLYVSGAQHFLPAFYRGLFDEGSMAKAVRLGRQQMWAHEGRVCARGKYPLQDWLLPVLYRQEPMDFSFAATDHEGGEGRESKLPEGLRLDKEPYGFIGRDSAILALERAMRRGTPAILIQGLGGVGKTTLARGFLQWLDSTGGLEYPPFWFSFQEIRSAEFVFNRLGEALFGAQFGSLPLDQKRKAAAQAFHEHPCLIVWDNFESAGGIAGTAVSANLPQEDRSLLASFLDELRGGETKVLITSRSTEDWLGPQKRFLLPLGGLDREERWEYCGAVLHDLGLTIDRHDKNLVELMNQLGGHPLAMRAMLPLLERMSAAQVVAALRTNMAGLGKQGDAAVARIYATLEFVQQSLPADLQPLLFPLGLHENYVDADFLEQMASQAAPSCTRPQIDSLMQALCVAGLLRDVGQAQYEMHPLLTSYLRSSAGPQEKPAIREKWTRAFVDVMGTVADGLASRPLQKQRGVFHVHGQNFYYALQEAERLEMDVDDRALTRSMASFAQNSRYFADASRLYERYAEKSAKAGDAKREASAYHQLGMVAAEQRDFVTAEIWYLKSLETKDRIGDEEGIATTYHQLGLLAQGQEKQSLARDWYLKSLAINQKRGNETGAAFNHNQLGIVALKEGDLAGAEEWLLKALRLKEKLGDKTSIASTLGQLGVVTETRRDFRKAEEWYRKALAIFEDLADKANAAKVYHQLGSIADEIGAFDAAEQYYRRSLSIEEEMGDVHGAGETYGNLGVLEDNRKNYQESGRWYIKCIRAFRETNDPPGAERNGQNFLIMFRHTSPEEQLTLRALWEEAGIGPFPEEGEGGAGQEPP
jgi:tetratricopeptide (TPR) repeat protein